MSESSKNTPSTHKRYYGIDLLRIISMIFVVMLHVIGQGGIWSANERLSVNYEVVRFLEICAYCAVDCYALISGYVGYEAKFKYRNIIYLCLQVYFYIIVITALFSAFSPILVTMEDFKHAISPLRFDLYWYFTAYFGMFFFIPFMNSLIKGLEKSSVKRLVTTLIIIFSILPTYFHNDLFKEERGFSVWWLMVMYLIGASIKKYHIEEKITTLKCLGGYIGCVMVTWLYKLAAEYLTKIFYGKVQESSVLVNYISPTILFSGIFLLLLFSKLSFKNTFCKIIAFFSPLTFSVYLIHAEPLIWNHVIKGRFTVYANYHPLLLILAVLVTSFMIWLICSLIDLPRSFLFKKLFKRK